MKKLSFLLALILLTCNSFAQDNKLSFGLNLFPNISVPAPVSNSNAPYDNPSVGYNFNDPLYNWIKFSFSANVFAQYAVSERFKLNGGLGYMNIGTTSIASPQQGAWVYNGETPRVNQHHIEIPLTFDLYFGK